MASRVTEEVAATTGGEAATVRVDVLGPLEVRRESVRVEPTSPKQRALLLDLVIHRGETVGRDRLIDHLWGESPPATAPGVLQNYLSQLRRALGADTVRTAGQGYALAAERVSVDIDEFESHLSRARAARQVGEIPIVQRSTTDALALWRGDPLTDVAFEAFAQAEINRLRELRAVALELQLEAEVSAGSYREAVAGLEAAVAEHPLHERLWWLLMLALYRSNRQADALRAYQRARSVLADELGLEPGNDLRDLERTILTGSGDTEALLVSSMPPPHIRAARPRRSLLGRQAEWSVIEEFLHEPAGLLLLKGEPGIGKTRLLEEAQTHVQQMGGTVIAGRGFEAERGRPYGAWVDALHGIPIPELDGATQAGLAALLPGLSDAPVALDDSNRLYDAVVRTLATLASAGPVTVLLDDLQWLDDPSVELLHFVIRQLPDTGVSLLGTARPGELDENPAVTRLLQALRRDDMLVEVPVGPLASATIAELTEPIAPGLDAQRIAEATSGNPLFALEMARALARGDEPLSSRIDALIGDRLARLSAHAAGLVPWIAAFGRGVPPAILVKLVESSPSEVFDALGELERYGVAQAGDDGSVDFVHDLVRSAAYKRLSTPRRAMLHARLGVVLGGTADPDASLAADIARHADLGGESATCAAACARAARRCLRLLAYPEAERLVALGRRHSQLLPDTERVAIDLELIHVLLHPGVKLHDPGELARDLAVLCADAQRLGLQSELSTGLLLLGRAYHWGWADIPRARALMQRSARLMELGDAPTLEPLLEGARCLAYLEIDMDRTLRLFDQLDALYALAEQSFQYQWGIGLVQAWRGDVGAARASLRRAIELAAASSEHWVVFECTARLALLELEEGTIDEAEPLCVQLASLASKLGEGSERPYAAAIGALLSVARHDPQCGPALDAAVAELERIDAQFLVPDVLGIAAQLSQRAGQLDQARDLAERAGALADEVDRPVESARAQVLLARIAVEMGDPGDAAAHLQAVDSAAPLPSRVEGLRQEVEQLVTALSGK